MSAAEPHVTRHKLTVAEYHRMSECGILAADARVELIEGEIIDMAPQGSAHSSVVAAFHERLAPVVHPLGQVRCQSPIALGERSEPEPDLAIVRARADYYRRAHPNARDVLLLIEVADKTLAYDCDVKSRLYAGSGVQALWIVDVVGCKIRCFTAPASHGYEQLTIVPVSGAIRLPPPFERQISLEGVL